MRLLEPPCRNDDRVAPAAERDDFLGLLFEGRKPTRLALPRRPAAVSTLVSPQSQPTAPDQESGYPSPNLSFVRTMLSLAGLNASGYRLPPLIRRIPACLRALKTDCLESALSMVQYDSKQLETAINALLIGTTSFFRDASVFASLDRFQIPGIIQRSPNPRVLSVASSGGEELYSIAMLFARHGALSRSRFVGRDCRPSAIATASRGCYSAHAGDIIPADLAAEHVSSVGGNLRIRPHLASKIEWECRDSLDKPAPSEKWDLILCRNLAIYLEAEVTRELWANLTDALAPGGFLVVGRAEKPRTSDLNCIAPCIYQKSNF